MMKAPVAHDGYGRVAKRLLLWGLAIIGAVVSLCFGLNGVVMVVMAFDERGQTVERARSDVGNLHTALRTYRRQVGSWPPEATWSEALVARGIFEKTPTDPWDRPYVYRLVSTDGGAPEPVVTSLGQDGVPDTADDVAYRPTAFPPPPPSPGG